MPSADGEALGQRALPQFPGQMPPWNWPPPAYPGALMTDALQQQYASGLDMRLQHIRVPQSWPRSGAPSLTHASDAEPGHASRVFQDIMHEYDEHAKRMLPVDHMPEKLGSLRWLDCPVDGPPMPGGFMGRRLQEAPTAAAIRQDVLAAATPARPTVGVRPGAPPGLEQPADLALDGQGRAQAQQRFFI